jgi:hypothetical protein
VGVGHINRPTIVSRLGNLLEAHADSGVIVAAIAEQLRGVGQLWRAAIVCKLGFRPPSPRPFCDPYEFAVGVGSNPNPLPPVRGATVVCSQHTPLRIVPELGQVSEYASKPSRSEHWAVFHEDESWSYLTNDPRHVPPEPASLPLDAGPLASCADVLAGKAARNDVNTASPWASVKGSDVIPDRERRQDSIVLARNEYVPGVGFALDGADCSPAEEMSTEDAATSAREERELS